ncbi:MAG: hypothetical protein ABSC06_28720 [Rhodopila sp.]
MPEMTERFAFDHTTPRAGVQTLGIALAATAKAAVIAAWLAAGANDIEADIPPAADLEEDDAIATRINEAGIVTYITALGIGAALLFVLAGLCAIL